VGGVPDVVTDDVEGVLVPAGRADLLAEAVIRVAKDPALRSRLAEASLARSALFDVRDAAQSIESVYTELLDARRPR
jgi:glycosyltransferase involved in cell wall biosynthesis